MKKIYFIGIGGAGMSALAKYARFHSTNVYGSDLSQSPLTDDLQNNYNVDVYIGIRPEFLSSDFDAVVYSPAVPENNAEYQRAIELGITLYSFPELLGTLSYDRTTIAVSGTNGKTTTTAMIIESMKDLGLDPTGIVGAVLQKYNSNFISGSSEYFITEACEYKKSFLNIHHDIVLITNITEDHLDYFKDLEDIQDTFMKFMDNNKTTGVLVTNTDLPNLKPIIDYAKLKGFSIIPYQKYLKQDLTLPIPGKHNLQNMAAALGVIEAIDKKLVPDAQKYLSRKFAGVKRRMEHIGFTENNTQIFDDYAHNVEGLEYLIEGLRDFYPDKKIIIGFEPHLYSRTRDFKDQFASTLEKVDVVYLFPTYRAREEQIPEEDFLLESLINSKNVELFPVYEPEKFKELFNSQDYNQDYIFITVGAGDVWKYGLELKKQIH